MFTNCEGERSFSKLKRIKNDFRTTMGQSRLNALSLLSIEWELLRELDTEKMIDDFAKSKARKKYMSIITLIYPLALYCLSSIILSFFFNDLFS